MAGLFAASPLARRPLCVRSEDLEVARSPTTRQYSGYDLASAPLRRDHVPAAVRVAVRLRPEETRLIRPFDSPPPPPYTGGIWDRSTARAAIGLTGAASSRP